MLIQNNLALAISVLASCNVVFQFRRRVSIQRIEKLPTQTNYKCAGVV